MERLKSSPNWLAAARQAFSASARATARSIGDILLPSPLPGQTLHLKSITSRKRHGPFFPKKGRIVPFKNWIATFSPNAFLLPAMNTAMPPTRKTTPPPIRAASPMKFGFPWKRGLWHGRRAFHFRLNAQQIHPNAYRKTAFKCL